GFDWQDAEGAKAKVVEETREVEQAVVAGNQHELHEEFGDLLFAMVNWARHLGVDPELALRGACDKFRRRFDHVEARVWETRGDWPRDERGNPTSGIPMSELDAHWDASKR